MKNKFLFSLTPFGRFCIFLELFIVCSIISLIIWNLSPNLMIKYTGPTPDEVILSNSRKIGLLVFLIFSFLMSLVFTLAINSSALFWRFFEIDISNQKIRNSLIKKITNKKIRTDKIVTYRIISYRNEIIKLNKDIEKLNKNIRDPRSESEKKQIEALDDYLRLLT